MRESLGLSFNYDGGGNKSEVSHAGSMISTLPLCQNLLLGSLSIALTREIVCTRQKL